MVRAQNARKEYLETRNMKALQSFESAAAQLQAPKPGRQGAESPPPEAVRQLGRMLKADHLVLASLVSLGDRKVRQPGYDSSPAETIMILRLALRVLATGPATTLCDDAFRDGNLGGCRLPAGKPDSA